MEFNDNGSGMPGEIVRWVNVADRNVEPPRSVHLGMREALRGIAEHDGIIRVTSSPVRGTTVQISLKTSDPLSSLC